MGLELKIHYHNEQIPLIIVDNLYDDEEEREIMVELDYLSDARRLIPPFEDESGAVVKNKNIKNVGCLYLDSFYNNRQTSSILQITEKLFMDGRSIIENHPHWFFDMKSINSHTTHMLYYENINEYPPHYDTCRITSLTYFYKQPKSFTGGDLYFSDFDTKVECRNNRVVVFPSILNHASTPVFMEEKHQNQKLGKYCITQFLDRNDS